MNRRFFSLVGAFLLWAGNAMPAWAAETYGIDPAHSGVHFKISHIGLSWIHGRFNNYAGTFAIDPDDAGKCSFEMKINTESIDTNNNMRDNHLRSPDFLDAAKHATITFKSTGCQCASPTDFKVSGVLTIRGISRPVDLDMHYIGQWKTPYWTDAGDAGPITRVGFVAKARINRQDFQVSWNGQLENGGAVVGDDVVIRIDVEALLETDIKRITRK